MPVKKDLSPDEFCIMLFSKTAQKERCEMDRDVLKERFDNFEELKVTFSRYRKFYHF